MKKWNLILALSMAIVLAGLFLFMSRVDPVADTTIELFGIATSGSDVVIAIGLVFVVMALVLFEFIVAKNRGKNK